MVKHYANLDLNLNQILNGVLQNSPSEPQSGVKGQIFFDTTVNRLKVYDGTKWVSSALTGNEVVALLNQATTKIKTSQIDGFSEALGQVAMSGSDIVDAINGGDTLINPEKIQYEASKTVKQALQEALQATDEVDGKVTNAKQDTLREAKEYSDSKINELINGAPGDLDTLKEIADVLSTNKDAIETLKQAPKKYAVTIGDGVATEYTVTHNLNTQDVVVTLREDKAPYEVVLADIEVTDVNSLLIRTAQAVEQDALKVVVVG